jgi:hypothetical protein
VVQLVNKQTFADHSPKTDRSPEVVIATGMWRSSCSVNMGVANGASQDRSVADSRQNVNWAITFN